MTEFKTARQKLTDLWVAGEYRAALKLAATWPNLGGHKDRIRQGWAATSNPAIYREMGRDPEKLYRDGLAAVAERYGLEAPNAK